jgi:hypothetical protein
MVLHSFGLTPMIFSSLPSEDAGRFIRAAFPWYYLFVIVTVGLSGAIFLLSDSCSAELTLAIAAVAIDARQALLHRISAARDGQLQGNAEAKGRLGRLHVRSVVPNFVQLIDEDTFLFGFCEAHSESR